MSGTVAVEGSEVTRLEVHPIINAASDIIMMVLTSEFMVVIIS